MNRNIGFYINKDLEMIEEIYKKCFKSNFMTRRKAITIKMNVALRLNDMRIKDNDSIENLSYSEITTKIFNMLDEEIKNLRKGKGEW